MRLFVCILFAATLAACSSTNRDNSVDTVCAEQAALAQNGTTAGGRMTITCPN
jgi:hypothetical protein